MKVIESICGTINGKPVKSYSILTDRGFKLTCIEYGCIITEILAPDQYGKVENIVLGFDSLEEYIPQSSYFGCVIGRVAGRIRGASLMIDDVLYGLPKNHGEHNLHGGPKGFDQVIWDSTIQCDTDEVSIKFSYNSPNGENGFPGNLYTNVTYTVTNSSELIISYRAISNQKTVVNLTNHSYFNLSGDLKRTILDHELTLKSERYLELDEDLIPTGNSLFVKGTVFDFRQGQTLSTGIESNDPQMRVAKGGYDHPFLLSTNNQKEIILMDKESGRRLVMETDEPSVVLYTGNSLGGVHFIRGTKSKKYLGLCLETQKPPNMINHPDFPSYLLDRNKEYTSKTKIRFETI
ncbi:aldose epimerase family protein [Bacillus salitolerans]|uniref:Aldose 1-epimerase n=1 Tax=Bacillus salitolerans TaxID=1437434 RepID=A0ABW4LJS8_9BACI